MLQGLTHVGGLQSFRTAGHLELHAVTLAERLEAGALDGAVVHEDVFAAFLRDEPEPLRVVEPLHGTGGHGLEPSFWGSRPCSLADGARVQPIGGKYKRSAS